MKPKARVLGITAMLALAALIAPAVPATAQPSTQACSLYAYNPYRTVNWIEADGGRTGCTNVVNIHVRLRQDISWWPDRTLDEHVQDGVINIDVHLSFPCLGWGTPIKVFTETIVGSTKVQSGRPILPCD